MAVHKYIFWMDENGIYSYKVSRKKYELIKHRGEERFLGDKIEEFFEWLAKVAAVSKDDDIDFCFMSDNETMVEKIKLPESFHSTKEKSSWNKEEILDFCSKQMQLENYEIMSNREKLFVNQKKNSYHEKTVKKLYLRCIPEFEIISVKEIEELKHMDENEVIEESILYKYYNSKLKEL